MTGAQPSHAQPGPSLAAPPGADAAATSVWMGPALAPLAATAQAPAPAPAAAAAPADVTVVRTAQELQQATLSGAVDIEIREHLSLLNLTRPPNPAQPGQETFQNRKHLALLYASSPLRSIRGNCSDPNPAVALGLSADLAPALLPLRPRQCLLLLPDTWLMVNSGTLWLDNLYLRAYRTLANPIFTFIQLGARDASQTDSQVAASANYITRLTFQPDGRGTTIGLTADINDISAVVDDCIFTDWMSFRSPFVVQYQSVFHIRNTVLRNFSTAAEIADVSFEGIVHFSNVSLANVTLKHGAVVSTTLNDYQFAIGYALTYYAEDDKEYDVTVTEVPLGEASMWGEEFVIVNASLGDCTYLLALDDTVYPGCPTSSTERRKAVKARAVDGAHESTVIYDESADAAVPYSEVAEYLDGVEVYPASAGAGEYQYYDYLGPGGAYLYDYFSKSDPNVWFVEKFLDMDDPWIIATQQALPVLLPTPDWPPLLLDPLPKPGNRTSLFPEPVPVQVLGQDVNDSAWQLHGPPLVPAMSWPGLGEAPLPQDPHHGRSFYVPFVVAVCVATVAVAIATVKLVPKQWLATASEWWQQPSSYSSTNFMEKVERMMTTAHRGTNRSILPIGHGIPTSALNPDFEYVLPPQLALIAHASGQWQPSSEPGDTIVLPPYTVSIAGVDVVNSCSKHALHPRSGGGNNPQSTLRRAWQRSCQDLAVRPTSRSQVQIKTNKQAHSGGRPGARSTQQQQPEVRRLHQQLDLFESSDLFLGRFEMLGRRQRRRGGQAGVQFMVDVSDRCEYAAKFFLDRDDFLTEAAVYAACFPSLRSTVFLQAAAHMQDKELNHIAECMTRAEVSDATSRLIPQVAAVCDAGTPGLEDPRGGPLPPCIVMERGESLHEWSERAVPDLFTSLAVLSNISKRLADMHEAGYAHRDVKPANIMWLPRQNRWTVIDFGCVARIGAPAPLSFTLAYAAPEVAVAFHRNDKCMECRAALDAWSLGVIAFELLTGAPTYNLLEEGAPGVAAKLLGEAPLPWEGSGGDNMKHKLGTFLGPVLQLLQREPSKRTSMRDFHVFMNVFARHATTAAPARS
eukprot:jgi/Ulvmu1/1086/UM106_0002.1